MFIVASLQVSDSVKGSFAELCLPFHFLSAPAHRHHASLEGTARSGGGPWRSGCVTGALSSPSHLPLLQACPVTGFPHRSSFQGESRDLQCIRGKQCKPEWSCVFLNSGCWGRGSFLSKTYFCAFHRGGGCQGCDKCPESWSSLLRLCDNVHSRRGHKMH